MAKQPKWTEAEDRVVKTCHGIFPPEEIAKLLKRTIKAVGIRASRLGVRKERYGYTVLDLVKELGLSQATAWRLVKRGIIKGQRRYTYEPEGNPKWWSVRDDQVIYFLQKHFLLYDPDKVTERWKHYIPYEELKKWIPLSVASSRYHYSYQWFYELIWRGFIQAQKGRSDKRPWELWLYEPDIKVWVTEPRMLEPFAQRNKERRAKDYKKGKARGWAIPTRKYKIRGEPILQSERK